MIISTTNISINFCFLYVSSIHSLSVGPIHYRISWESKGILQRNGFASNIDTKEVIGGQSDSGSSSGGGGISFIGISSATIIHNVQAQQGCILLFLLSVTFLQFGTSQFWLC